MIHEVHSQEELETMCKVLSTLDLFACDTETEEFDKKNNRVSPMHLGLMGTGIVGYDTNNKEYAYYINHSEQLDYSPLTKVLGNRMVIFHNAKFDLQVMRRHGLIKEFSDLNIQDTLLLSHILDENRSHGLKSLAKEVLDKDVDEVITFESVKMPQITKQPFKKIKDEGERVTAYKEALMIWHKKLVQYCIDDCRNTYLLYERFTKEISEDSRLLKIYSELDLPIVKILADMEYRGVRIDENFFKEKAVLCQAKVEELQNSIFKLCGTEFNINSPRQLSIQLSKAGCLLPVTEKGNPSTNSEVLRDLAKGGNELASLVDTYREYYKLLNTYLIPLPKIAIDGIIHCSYNQTGTVTGRFSSSNPNLQNIPTRDDDFNIRQAFTPREQHGFIICDYSQQELRILAYYSKDKRLLDAYKRGEDIHAVVAEIVGCSRAAAKTISFGIAYGRSANGIAVGLGIDFSEAKAILDDYLEQFKGIKEYIDTMSSLVADKQEVTTLIGRPRRFPEYGMDSYKDAGFRRQGINAPIQGSGADIMKIAMRNMYEPLKSINAHLLLQIHDEVIVEAPIDKLEEAKNIVQHYMETALDLGEIPLVAEPKICFYWEK